MSIQMVLLPLFVHVAMLLVLPIFMGGLRATPTSTEIYPRAWLHLPLLFYVLTILAQMTRMADLLFVLLAWVFVVLQVLDALILVAGSGEQRRAMLLPVSAIVLAVMWVIFMLRVLLAI
jgi:hypothetical protein